MVYKFLPLELAISCLNTSTLVSGSFLVSLLIWQQFKVPFSKIWKPEVKGLATLPAPPECLSQVKSEQAFGDGFYSCFRNVHAAFFLSWLQANSRVDKQWSRNGMKQIDPHGVGSLKGLCCSGKCRWGPSPPPDLPGATWIYQGCWFSSCKRCSLRCGGHFLKMGLWFLSSITYILKAPMGTVLINHRSCSQNTVYFEQLFYSIPSPLSLALHVHTCRSCFSGLWNQLLLHHLPFITNLLRWQPPHPTAVCLSYCCWLSLLARPG